MQFDNFWNRLALLLILFGVNTMLFGFVVSFSAGIIWGVEAMDSPDALRYINSLGQIGIFGLTAYLFAYFVSNEKPIPYLFANKGITLRQCCLLIILFFVSTPAISTIVEWNANLQLPEFMSAIENWMRKQEDSTAQITEKILSGTRIQILLLNLLTVGLVPAVCEEFLFRGALFHCLRNSIKNIHLVIFLTAFLFSFIHVQFYGFVPRLLLGLYFGYLILWTGSIWSSVIAHFLNNSVAVVVAYLYNNQIIETSFDNFGNTENFVTITASILFTTLCLYWFYKKKVPKKEVKLSEYKELTK